MKKIKFIRIASTLGIVLPTSLLGIAENCEASEAKNSTENLLKIEESEQNPIKERIINLFSEEEQTPPTEIAHTNVHANFKVSHTNVHADFKVDGKHTNDHSNTRASHTDEHSNSRI